jgi:hypothetical protein
MVSPSAPGSLLLAAASPPRPPGRSTTDTGARGPRGHRCSPHKGSPSGGPWGYLLLSELRFSSPLATSFVIRRSSLRDSRAAISSSCRQRFGRPARSAALRACDRSSRQRARSLRQRLVHAGAGSFAKRVRRFSTQHVTPSGRDASRSTCMQPAPDAQESAVQASASSQASGVPETQPALESPVLPEGEERANVRVRGLCQRSAKRPFMAAICLSAC